MPFEIDDVFADAEDLPSAFADEAPPRRGRGKPKGLPRSGGRQAGSLNKRTILGAEALAPLASIARKRLRALLLDPMLTQENVIALCKLVLAYCYGRPVETQHVAAAVALKARIETRETSPRELAQLLSFTLEGAATLARPAIEPEPAADGAASMVTRPSRPAAGGSIARPSTSPDPSSVEIFLGTRIKNPGDDTPSEWTIQNILDPPGSRDPQNRVTVGGELLPTCNTTFVESYGAGTLMLRGDGPYFLTKVKSGAALAVCPTIEFARARALIVIREGKHV